MMQGGELRSRHQRDVAANDRARTHDEAAVGADEAPVGAVGAAVAGGGEGGDERRARGGVEVRPRFRQRGSTAVRDLPLWDGVAVWRRENKARRQSSNNDATKPGRAGHAQVPGGGGVGLGGGLGGAGGPGGGDGPVAGGGGGATAQ